MPSVLRSLPLGVGRRLPKRLARAKAQVPPCRLCLLRDHLYGTTPLGGWYERGLVFRVNTVTGKYQNLHLFTGGADGSQPYAGLLAHNGYLYGTAEYGGATQHGVVFRMRPDGSQFSALHNFQGGADGGLPLTDLIVGHNGRLFGMTGG